MQTGQESFEYWPIEFQECYDGALYTLLLFYQFPHFLSLEIK